MYKRSLTTFFENNTSTVFLLLCITLLGATFISSFFSVLNEFITTSFFLFGLYQAPQGKTIDQIKNESYKNYQDRYRENLKQELDETKLDAKNNREESVSREGIEDTSTKKAKKTTVIRQKVGKVTDAIEKQKKRMKVARLLSVAVYPLGGLYFLQFLFGLIAIAGLAAVSSIESIPLVGEWIVSGINWLSTRLTGSEFIGLFGIFLVLAVIIGWLQLILLLIIFYISGVKALGGEFLELKWTAFILAASLYIFPIANLFPLAALWLLLVFLFPK